MAEMKELTRKLKEVHEKIKADIPWEPIGHTPMPEISDLRSWDMKLLQTYKPFYAPFCDLCCFCTYGKCDLTEDRRGACGIDIGTQQGRWILLACLMGASAHASHSGHILELLIEKHGPDKKINLGTSVELEAPIIRTVLGLKPETLGDLKIAIEYVYKEITQLLDATNMGQEGSNLDYESKALHAGMLDHVGMEVGDIAQIVGFNYPTSVADTPLVDLGWNTVDKTKPIILFVGHNPATSTVVVDYLRENDLYDKVEFCGVCCTALETSRYSDKAKVIGPYSRQLFFIRSGFADVIMTDEQCIRTDMPQEATKAGSALIATLDKVMYGLEDATEMETGEIVKKMVEEKKHFAILDPKKAAEAAVKVALALAPQRRKEWITEQEATELAAKCSLCGMCETACPNLFEIGKGVNGVAKGNFDVIKEQFNLCIGCGKCEQECPKKIPIMKIMQVGASKEKWKIRAGRGPIMDTEIRTVGAPITLGTIPGVVALVGCSNFPDIRDLAEIVDEFARRKYIVVVSGCTAMAVGMWKDADGKTIYEKYPGDFDAGCVVNVGSCVANSHIAGAAIKIANIFAALPLRANYEVMADYVLNRVGAVGIAWGVYSQKAASIGTGFNRLGVPVILGPHSSKYRRLYLSRKEEDEWKVMDARKRQIVETNEPSPEHLAYVCETKEKAMVMIPKLCIRKNDTPQGRGIKLNHYISLYKKYMGGGLPEDLPLYVRRDADIPLVYKKEVKAYLTQIGWKPKEPVGLPTLIGTYPTKVPVDSVIH
ncbi:MAG TPA: CO dehydrogenase/acetyl-CoA synthase complex subunit alpha [Thermodesulfobacteriota bacterium]|nr:CO dehydrogenase/acetyl-CoA synthase complex subunit alpha [Thermodesulfobacteriota bacterium]